VTAVRHRHYLLALLCLLAFGNGLLLGLSLYSLLAVALKAIGASRPSIAYALLVGTAAGVVVLVLALRRAEAFRDRTDSRWAACGMLDSTDRGPGRRLTALTAASSLDAIPRLSILRMADPNAFAIGRSRDDASVVVTTGLLALLGDAELDAVLAHELAHIEAEDVQAVGLADAVADSVEELGRLKGKLIWGPRAIVREVFPVVMTLLVGWAAILAIPKPSPESSDGTDLGLILLLLVVGLIALAAVAGVAIRSLRGLFQLFVFIILFGPIAVAEALTAPPCALALSKLISRTREYAADRRSAEITGNPGALISAFEKLATHRSAAAPDGLRFSLFVGPPEAEGFRGWVMRLYATHPPISSRIAALRKLA